jgi:hypothetical protein
MYEGGRYREGKIKITSQIKKGQRPAARGNRADVVLFQDWSYK